MNSCMVSHAKIVWVLPEFLWHYCCFELFDFSNLVLWIFFVICIRCYGTFHYGIFRVALLFICQRTLLPTLPESATAYLKYHIFICLSTTFFETLKFLFQFLSCIGFPQQRNWVYHPFYWMSTLNFDFFLIFWTIYFKSRKRPIYRHFRLFSALLF